MSSVKSGKKTKAAKRTPDELYEEYMELKHQLDMTEMKLAMLVKSHEEMRDAFFAEHGAKLRETTDRWQAMNLEYEQTVTEPIDRMEMMFRAKQRPFKKHMDDLQASIANHPGRHVYDDDK